MIGSHTRAAAGRFVPFDMHRLLLWMLVVLAVAIFGLVATNPPRAFTLAKEARDRGLLSDYLRADVAHVLSIITRDTRFDGAWAINEPARSGRLNVYLLKPGFHEVPGIPRDLLHLRNNCAYLGSDVIFCDTWFLDTFLERRRITSDLSFLAHDGRERHRTTFLLWVLAHEVGHAVHGHGPRHFTRSEFETEVSNATASHRFEFAADEHLVRLLGSDIDLERDVLRLLSDLLRAEVLYKATGAYPRAAEIATGSISSGMDIPYRDDGTHPEYVMRIARITLLTGELPRRGNELIRDDAIRLLTRLRRENP